MKTTNIAGAAWSLIRTQRSPKNTNLLILSQYLQIKQKGIYKTRMKFKGNLLPVADLNLFQSLERQLYQNSSKAKDAIVSSYICRVKKYLFVIRYCFKVKLSPCFRRYEIKNIFVIHD